MPQANLAQLVKLASIAVHVEEMFEEGIQVHGPGGVADLNAIDGLLKDPDVKAIISELREGALVPEKR